MAGGMLLVSPLSLKARPCGSTEPTTTLLRDSSPTAGLPRRLVLQHIHHYLLKDLHEVSLAGLFDRRAHICVCWIRCQHPGQQCDPSRRRRTAQAERQGHLREELERI